MSTQPLRVGFDGRDLLRKRTGVTGYAAHLARQLAQRHSGLVVYADPFVDPAVQPPPELPLRRLAAPPVAWKHLALPLTLLRDGVHLFHSPTGTLPLWTPTRRVVTIHDLFADVEPAWFPRRTALHLQRAQRRAAGSADAIIAVSETTRRDLLARYRLPPWKVHVVHNGVDHGRFRPGRGETAVARALGVRPPFVLCVGSLLPWRNAPRLLRAVAALRQRHPELGLLFVGRDIWGTDPTAALARDKGWLGWARFAGYLPDDDLAPLYAAADVLAAPSLYEGFGIPPLEAMACGTPVVASTAGALPEVLGDAALLVDPTSEGAIADALGAVLEDAALRAELRRRGLARAARYSWQRAAEQTWRVYQAASR